MPTFATAVGPFWSHFFGLYAPIPTSLTQAQPGLPPPEAQLSVSQGALISVASGEGPLESSIGTLGVVIAPGFSQPQECKICF